MKNRGERSSENVRDIKGQPHYSKVLISLICDDFYMLICIFLIIYITPFAPVIFNNDSFW